MVQLLEQDIQTKEVLGFEGLHLYHSQISSCSQKTRIFLNIKGLNWTSHPVALEANEHLQPYFLGINPRGLVPVLVDDGAVHIESNDILLYLEDKYPDPPLMPQFKRDELEKMLRFEDDLHLDLRTLSVRFLFAPPQPLKSEEDLARYASTGSGTVRGEKDSHIAREIDFWNKVSKDGISDQDVRAAALKFREALTQLEERLSGQPYLLGSELSLVDIAWVVYAERLRLAGYPLETLHPRMAGWLSELSQRPEFAKEIGLPGPLEEYFQARQQAMAERGDTLQKVCFP